MTGGGFGGSAIVLVEAGDADRITKAVEEAFGAAGFTAPRIFAGGAFGGSTPNLLTGNGSRRGRCDLCDLWGACDQW